MTKSLDEIERELAQLRCLVVDGLIGQYGAQIHSQCALAIICF